MSSSSSRQVNRAAGRALRLVGSHRLAVRMMALAALFVGLLAIGASGRSTPTAAAWSGGWLWNVKVIQGSSSGVSCGGNTFEWRKDGTDLNKGAGGKYIYLCYKVHGESPRVGETISHMYAIRSSIRSVACPNGDTKLDGASNYGVDGNLNAGSGGQYIFFCVRRFAAGHTTAITGMKFAVLSGGVAEWFAKGMAATYCNVAAPPWPQRSMDSQDLNDTVGGAYIYTCYEKSQA